MKATLVLVVYSMMSNGATEERLIGYHETLYNTMEECMDNVSPVMLDAREFYTGRPNDWNTRPEKFKGPSPSAMANVDDFHVETSCWAGSPKIHELTLPLIKE